MSHWSINGETPKHDVIVQKPAATAITNSTEGTAQGSIKTKDATIIINDGTRDTINMSPAGIVVSDISNPRVQLNGNGIKVSKPGVNVSTATNDQLILNSDFNAFKIVASGTAVLTVPNPPTAGTPYTVTIAHNLGYPPAYQAYMNGHTAMGYPVGSYYPLPQYTLNDSSTGFWTIRCIVMCWSDATNIYFQVTPSDASNFHSGSWSFKYYLLQETAS